MKNVKKILIITALVLLIIVIASFLLYFFKVKNIEFKKSYTNETVKYLDSNIYKLSDTTGVSTLWVYEMEPDGDNIRMSFLTPDRDVELYIPKESISVQENVEYIENKDGRFAPLFLYVEFSNTKKDIKDQLSCIFGNSEKCVSLISISDIQIYENKYPFPTLSSKQSKEFMLFNIEKNRKYVTDPNPEDMQCTYLISSYVVNKNSEILEEITKLDCQDLSSQMLYANLLDSSDPFYKQVQEKVCPRYENLEDNEKEELFGGFPRLEIYNNMCDKNHEMSKDKIPYFEGIYPTVINILYLVNSKESPEFDLKYDEMAKLLSKDFITTFSSPLCYRRSICNSDLLNNSEIFFDLDRFSLILE